MSKQQQQPGEPAPKHEGQPPEFCHRIGKHVMHVLGEPDDLRRVQVQHLWAHQYRVNVYVGTDMASAKIAHSYFLIVDDDGKIASSTPNIAKHYCLAANDG